MTVEEITTKRHELENTIRNSLTFHVKSDIMKIARNELLTLRETCPHKADEEVCPYCGKKNNP